MTSFDGSNLGTVATSSIELDERLAELVENINRWRQAAIGEYWLRVSYLGGELNRFGDHELTFAKGKLWHRWRGEWREIEQGSDFWLFSVPGAFAWARDMLTKVLPQRHESSDALTMIFNDDTGHLELLQFEAGHRDASNFTFEIKRFEAGAHPDFTA